MRIRSTSLPALPSVLFIITSATGTAARAADVTIIATATVSGTIPGQGHPKSGGGAGSDVKPESTTTTMYFQGHKVRIESDHSVVLYDADTKTRYTIDPAAKTYSLGPDMQAAMPGLAKMLDIKTTVAVAPAGTTRPIVGQNAKEYDYSENISLSFKPGAFSQGGATAPKPTVPKAAPVPIMVIKVQGKQWVGSVIGLPQDLGGILQESSGLSQLTKTLPGLKSLSDELKSIKGYPLASHQVVTMTGLGIAAAMGQGNAHFTVDTITTAIRQTPLSKTLFVLPSGYKRVEAPSAFPKGGVRKQPEMPF